MDLKHAILDWIAKRDADARMGASHAALGRATAAWEVEAHRRAERALLDAVAALDPRDNAPLSEAARLWQAAKRLSRFAIAPGRHGTGPCPEIGHALRAAEAVLHVLVTGNPGASPDTAPTEQYFRQRPPDQPDDGSFEFVDGNGDSWVIRDCEEDAGCTVVERLHRDEIARAAREGHEPEPVQVIDVPPDLCGVVSRALASRTGRVAEQKRTSH